MRRKRKREPWAACMARRHMLSSSWMEFNRTCLHALLLVGRQARGVVGRAGWLLGFG